MKFGQWIEYYIINIVFEKSYTKCGGEIISRPFSKKSIFEQNWAYHWINNLKFYTICFYCMPSWGLSKYVETELQTICFYLLESFLKSKKWSRTTIKDKSYGKSCNFVFLLPSPSEQCWETMSKTCVKLCYGFETLYREREGVL